jgi:GTP-dependent dephospho-CoA kinase
MTVVYTLTEEMRVKFKEPFGTLIEGSFVETMNKMKSMINQLKPSRIISVGDVVSLNLHEYGFNPQLSIIDNKSLRTQIMPERTITKNTVHVVNPQGTITKEATVAVKEALEKNEHVHIVVEGEEDLLVLIAVLHASEGDFVVYGQPHVGIVVIKVSGEKKGQVERWLNAMKPSKS